MFSKKLIFTLFIGLAVVAVTAGCGKTAINQSNNPADDIKTAKQTLIAFFDNLADKKYDQAIELFEPSELDSWQWLSDFGPLTERDDKAKILKNYCLATQTCLKAKIIEAKKYNENEFILTVQFFDDNNEVFVLGPCCGATEEEMPPMDKFEFKVQKINNLFKVATPPVYVP